MGGGFSSGSSNPLKLTLLCVFRLLYEAEVGAEEGGESVDPEEPSGAWSVAFPSSSCASMGAFSSQQAHVGHRGAVQDRT